MNTPNHTPTLGNHTPKRHGSFAPKVARLFNRMTGWTISGEVPNIAQAVIIGAPHTSNFDGVHTLPLLIELGIDIKILGKKELFGVPVLSQFLRWAGVLPIDRGKKGSVLQAAIDRFATGEPLFLGLAPEGTRGYTEGWKTGFYYLAVGAKVPILPVALDYGKKQMRFMPLFYPTGDIDADLPKIYAMYAGITPKHPKNLCKPLQELNQ